MRPYEDKPRDIAKALEYALSAAEGKGGFILVAARDSEMVGAIVILKTGMSGYIPENLLVFVGVQPSERGHGIGGRLVNEALDRCEGSMKLHVEYDNPAKRLYERIGFTTKYAEMRCSREERI
ncbi:MAG: GNAT family N-acetyltransferase [Candidatus Eisenbacteria bacterium]|nr:GNAT family N-acetyltransferase [Candidatus Eisenbacteria bacterium]